MWTETQFVATVFFFVLTVALVAMAADSFLRDVCPRCGERDTSADPRNKRRVCCHSCGHVWSA